MKHKLILLTLFSVIAAFFLQTCIGVFFLTISEFIWPNEITFIGALAFIILPHPLSLGLLLLPLISAVVFYFTRILLIKKGLLEKPNWFKNAKKYLDNPIHIIDYMNIHDLTLPQVKALINSGKVSAYGGVNDEDIYIDET